MSPWTALTIATITCCTWMIRGDQVPCQDQLSSADSYQKIKFSLVNKRNQTGHWGTQFRLDKESSSKTRNWKMDFELSNRDKGGVYNFYLFGTMTAPPPLPADYELFPGVGYYKFHYDKRYTYSEAAYTCAKEGGHLVIINSLEENRSIQTLYSKFKANATGGSYIGYYDPQKNRNFVTVFEESRRSRIATIETE
ncbi:hypothetical protein J437_LFUL002020 [Ladona fulva]|uniref:C-type lectin domain-containing protein n=1 Tax=Ladona fulva TaxID=123851 RepID=A0A8K0NVD7_LADFU|nr:hypothetical protein J437_LFUL002020 [Ladona fulva]